MDNKMLNMSEAFIKMTESFLRVVKAVKDAKFAIDNMLRLQYKALLLPRFPEGHPAQIMK